MPRPAEDTQKHTLHLFSGDYAKIQEIHQADNIGAAYVIRRIVRKYITDWEKSVKTKIKHVELEL